MPEETLGTIFQARAQIYKDKIALMVKKDGRYEAVSWQECSRNIRYFSIGLLSLGTFSGECIALMSENRPEWVISDFAILSIGAITVAIPYFFNAGEIKHILHNSRPKIIILSNFLQAKKILSIKACLKFIKTIIILDEQRQFTAPEFIYFQDIINLGKKTELENPSLFYDTVNSVKPDDIASIVYTFSEDGKYKGAMLTHRNFLSNYKTIIKIYPHCETDIYLSYMPLNNLFERLLGNYVVLFQGGCIAYAENYRNVFRDIRKVRPTIIHGAPKFFETAYSKVLLSIQKKSPLKRFIILWSLKQAIKCSSKITNKYNFIAKIKFLVLKRLILNRLKVKTIFGNRLKLFISGSAPFSQEIAEFFYCFGILILDAYGLTEASPGISTNTLKKFKFGTVGQPLPDIKIRIADDGEILVKGDSIMKGYYKYPQDTLRVVGNGWLHTGDIGYLDEGNFIVITDRKKDIIALSSGEKIAPCLIENVLKTNKYIKEAWVFGERKRHLVALVTPNLKNLMKLAFRKNIKFSNSDELLQHPVIKEYILKISNQELADLSNSKKIKRVLLLNNNRENPGNELRQDFYSSRRVKRKIIEKIYGDTIKSMYDENQSY